MRLSQLLYLWETQVEVSDRQLSRQSEDWKRGDSQWDKSDKPIHGT